MKLPAPPLEITVLNLSHGEHTTIPKEVFWCKNLKQLTLGSNKITHIPEEIGTLKELEYLGFSKMYNGLDSLCFPATIKQCTKLKHLKLIGNYLDGLPSGMEYLQALKKIELKHNRLQQLTDQLLGCVALEELLVSQNNLKELPAFLGELRQLRIIQANNNQLKFIHPAIGNCPQLEELHLQYNQLITIPIEVLESNSINSIIAHNNQIERLPEINQDNHVLQNLKLNYNQLESLPESIGQYKKLELLGLSNNKLQSVPASLAQLKNVRSLSLGGNDWQEFPTALLALENLKQLKGQEAFIPDPYFRVFTKLLRTFKKQQVPLAKRYPLFQIFINNKTYIQQLPQKFLLEHLHFPQKMIQDNIVQTLCKTFDPKTLSTKSKITFLGDTIQPIDDIQERLDGQGITYDHSITANTTHLLIGKYVKTKLEVSRYTDIQFLNEQQLLFFLEEKEQVFLKSGDVAEQQKLLENISNLLASKEKENILLAIEILRSGGVPRKLLPLLMIIYKTSDKDIQQPLKQLLTLNGSYLLSYALNANWRLDDPFSYTIGKKIKLLADNTKLNKDELITHLIQRLDTEGHALMLNDYHLDDQAKQAVLTRYEQGTTLNLRDMLFYSFPSVIARLNAWKTLELSKVNVISSNNFDLVGMTQLKKLIIHECRLPCIPQNIHLLHQLEEIDAIDSHIGRIRNQFDELPALKKVTWRKVEGIVSFQESIFRAINLQELEISGMGKVNFMLNGIQNLTQLKQLNLAANHLEDAKIEVLAALTKLQTLHLTHNNISKIPESFHQLQNLRKLYLSAANPKQQTLLYQLGQEIIPYCEIIFS